jgi:hypothetical protein
MTAIQTHATEHVIDHRTVPSLLGENETHSATCSQAKISRKHPSLNFFRAFRQEQTDSPTPVPALKGNRTADGTFASSRLTRAWAKGIKEPDPKVPPVGLVISRDNGLPYKNRRFRSGVAEPQA